MHLTDGQIDRLYDTMGSLLLYVNARFHVVEGFDDPFATYEAQAKAAVVTRTLWDNVEIIDDFVAENPFGLDGDCLCDALGWKDALHGPFVFVRHSHGCALLMNDAGVFAVRGIAEELSGILISAPDTVRTVLLPFDGGIIYDGWLAGLGEVFSADDARAVQDKFEAACTEGIAWTAEDFARRARPYNAALREEELDALLSQAQFEAALDGQEEKLPEGFHRGVLAGLDEAQRQAAIKTRLDEVSQAEEGLALAMLSALAAPAEPSSSWAACLAAALRKSDMEHLAHDYGIAGISALRKADAAEKLACGLAAPGFLEEALRACDPGVFSTARTLASEHRIEFPADDESARKHAMARPLVPFTFLFSHEGRFSVVMPDEVCALCARVDFDSLARLRAKDDVAFRCADACATFYGVISLDDAYERYREVCLDCLDKPGFCALIWDEAVWGDSGFGAWSCDGRRYLVNYSLCDDFVAKQIAAMRQDVLRDRINDALREGEAAVDAVFESMKREIDEELARLERLRLDLIDMHDDIAVRPLDAHVAYEDVVDVLLAREQVVRLRDFLDAHVPDGQDDCLFADRVCESVVSIAIEDGDAYGALSHVEGLGLSGCSQNPDALARFVENACACLPSWENNGWSREEYTERMTGRKTFYDASGRVVNVGRDDACPCGSGKKYKDCCGR